MLFGSLIVIPMAAASPALGAPTHVAAAAAGTADWIGAIAEAITALTIGVVIVQLRDGRKTARIERTRGFQERYQSDAFDFASRRMIGCMNVDDTDGCIAVIEACSNRADAIEQVLPWPDQPSKASVRDVTRTLNFFEEMGAAFMQKQLDEKTLIASFSVPIGQVFFKSWWWICWERRGRLAREIEDGFTEEGYVEHQDMVLALRKKNDSLVVDPLLQTNDSIRALCLPAGSGENAHDPDDDLAWAASRRLSAALSTLLVAADIPSAQRGTIPNQLSQVSAALGKVPPLSEGSAGSPPRGWDVFLVPKEIDQPCDEDWGEQRREANQIARSLGRFANYPSLETAVQRLEEMASATLAAAGSGGSRS
jgi:hypothetical protein